MELTLNRIERTENSTIGELKINGIWECWILEDKDRGLRQDLPFKDAQKVYGKTCIPSGRYEVIISWSNRFKRQLPLLMKVPGYEGIRMHPGNSEADTLGCLLPGQTKSVDFVGASRAAFAVLFVKLQHAMDKEKVFISIT